MQTASTLFQVCMIGGENDIFKLKSKTVKLKHEQSWD